MANKSSSPSTVLHPGKVLKKQFLDKISISQNALADEIGVARNRVHAIIRGQRSVTVDTDLRLCKFFKVSEGYFLNLQNLFDRQKVKRQLQTALKNIKPYR
ncbi:MAG: HigA family addiction module antidote protein [Alphaproteobacteria bacterium]|nr:HigA family addiction module antidote protein [Alphaproteobacteria bacterium]